jgi:hypothetical protein
MNIILRYRNILLAAAIIFVFVMVIRATHTNYARQIEDIKAQEALLEKGQKTLEEWNKLGSEYSRLSTKFLKKDVLLFKRFVEDSARAQGINIASLRLSQEDQGFYWDAVIKLNTVCSYKSFAKFTDLLEGRRIQTEDISISSVDDNIKVDLSIKGVIVK